MKAWCAQQLRRLADWLDPPPPVRTSLSPLEFRAVALTQWQDGHWPDRDGEAKRHQVYAQLVKEWPDTSRREISRAIETALKQ